MKVKVKDLVVTICQHARNKGRLASGRVAQWHCPSHNRFHLSFFPYIYMVFNYLKDPNFVEYEEYILTNLPFLSHLQGW